MISIHALREEGDARSRAQGGRLEISIHALREEGDPQNAVSTSLTLDFYPRPPRGGRLAKQSFYGLMQEISIHALREEGDTLLC